MKEYSIWHLGNKWNKAAWIKQRAVMSIFGKMLGQFICRLQVVIKRRVEKKKMQSYRTVRVKCYLACAVDWRLTPTDTRREYQLFPLRFRILIRF